MGKKKKVTLKLGYIYIYIYLFAFQKSHRVLLLTKNLDIAMYKPARISQKESNISKVSFGSSLISKRPKTEWNEIF